MPLNRIELNNEIHMLREKTCSKKSLSEILLRLKKIALSLDDRDTLEWIDWELDCREGYYYLLKDVLERVRPRTSLEISNQAESKRKITYIENALSHRVVFPNLQLEVPRYVQESELPGISDRELLYSSIQVPYYCTSPIGVLEKRVENGLKFPLPHRIKEDLLNRSKRRRLPIPPTQLAQISRLSLFIKPDDINSILTSVRNKLVDYFDKVLQDQPLDIIDVFYKLMDHIYGDIRKFYPKMMGQFETIHLNIVQDKPEGFSDVASACRRILKIFADTEYKPEKEVTTDGHELTAGHEKNRIIQWIKENTEVSSQTKVISANLELRAKYIDSVYALASKGDKNPITKYDAELCSIHTYLIIAELIRIKQSTPSSSS